MQHAERRSRWRVPAMVAGVVALYAAAGQVPLPGLEGGAAAAYGGTKPRPSIVALGIAPYFTVLTLAELARLVIPALARRKTAPAGRRRMAPILVGLALLLALVDGVGLVEGLQGAGLAVVSPAMAWTQVAALVIGTAVLIALARLVRLPGLGDGFWLLATLPSVATLPVAFGQWMEMARIGAASPGDVLAAFCFVLAAFALAGLADTALRRSPLDRRTEWPGPAPVLLWPPFLAAIVSGPLLLLGSSLVPSASALGIDLASLAVQAIGIGIFMTCYARRAGVAGVARPVFVVVATIQIGIVAGAAVLPHLTRMPHGVGGANLIAMTAVMLALIRAVRPGGFGTVDRAFPECGTRSGNM